MVPSLCHSSLGLQIKDFSYRKLPVLVAFTGLVTGMASPETKSSILCGSVWRPERVIVWRQTGENCCRSLELVTALAEYWPSLTR
jgi:hypothetical protein